MLLLTPILAVTTGALFVRPTTAVNGLATAVLSLLLVGSVAWLGGRADESWVEAGLASVLTLLGLAALIGLRRASQSADDARNNVLITDPSLTG